MQKIKWLRLGIFLSLFFCNSILADTQTAYINPQDPYEKFNRVMFRFNDFVDKWALKPIATLYNKIVPKPLTKGIGNFYYNIDTVPTVFNDVLQGNIYQATNDTWRLALNSTVGLLGFFDVAADIGLERNSEDFGLTLARWGYTNSNYLVIPFLGPSTVRDGVAFPINYYLFTIYPYVNPPRDRYRLYLLGVVSKRADLLRYQSVFEQVSLDKYVFMRDAYMQRRAYQIQRNKELGDPYLNGEGNKDINSQESTDVNADQSKVFSVPENKDPYSEVSKDASGQESKDLNSGKTKTISDPENVDLNSKKNQTTGDSESKDLNTEEDKK